jgi:hypothetical protein
MYADPRLMHDVGYEMLSAFCLSLMVRKTPTIGSSPDHNNPVPEIGVRSLYKNVDLLSIEWLAG